MRTSVAAWMAGAGIALGAASAQADDPAAQPSRPAFYAGALAGFTWTNQDGSRLTGDLRARGHDVTASVDDTSYATGLYGGWEITSRIAVEAGVLWLDQNALAIAGATGDENAFARDLADLRPVSGWSFSLAARGRVPLAADVALLPKAGVYYWTQKSDFDSGSGTLSVRSRGAGLLAGLALAWRVIPHVELGAGIDLLRPRRDDFTAMLSGRVEYRFGG